jgi:hypothetical protein
VLLDPGLTFLSPLQHLANGLGLARKGVFERSVLDGLFVGISQTLPRMVVVTVLFSKIWSGSAACLPDPSGRPFLLPLCPFRNEPAFGNLRRLWRF